MNKNISNEEQLKRMIDTQLNVLEKRWREEKDLSRKSIIRIRIATLKRIIIEHEKGSYSIAKQ